MALILEKSVPSSSVYSGPPHLRGFGIRVPSGIGARLREEAGLPPVPRSSGGGRFSRAIKSTTRNIKRVGEQITDELTSAPGNVVDIVKEAAEDVGEVAQEVVDVGKAIVGAEGLTIREIAKALDLRGSVDFVLAGVFPWTGKVTLYADQLETVPLAQIRGAARSDAPSLLNALGLDIATPPGLPGQAGLLQSPMGQLVTVGVSFVPGFGTLIAASLGALGTIGSAFGRRETEKRQKLLQTRIVNINGELQKQLNRSVQLLGFLGDPDALDVLGVVPDLAPTIAAETRPTRFATVLPVVAVGGAAVLAVTALSGIRSRPGVLGRASAGLGALDPANNLGLPELSDLIDATNRLESENNRLAAFLLEVTAIEQAPPAMPGVKGFGQVPERRSALPAILGLTALAAFAGVIATRQKRG